MSQLSTRHPLPHLPFLTVVQLWYHPSGSPLPLSERIQIILTGVCTCAAEDPASSCPQNQHRCPWPAGEAAGSSSAATLPEEGSHVQLWGQYEREAPQNQWKGPNTVTECNLYWDTTHIKDLTASAQTQVMKWIPHVVLNKRQCRQMVVHYCHLTV